MSSSPLIVLMALTSILVLPGAGVQTTTPGESVADLLLKDRIEEAEALLNGQPETPRNTAFRGEVEFRRGNFEKAGSLYKAALAKDDKTARAHFGMGKLSLGKVKSKDAVRSFSRAIELDPTEPLYRLYASEAFGIEKNTVEQRKHLEEYIRLQPNDPDRVAEAKAGLEMLQAFANQEIGKVVAPENPEPVRFRKSLNLIFASVMVNGQGPYDFVIDTGASQTVLSEKLAGELGLKEITTTIMHGVGGVGKVESKIFRADEIRIGDAKILNLPVGTFNDPLVTQIADGIIGTATLSDFYVTVNYPENQLELTRKKPDLKGEALSAWYFSNLLLVPLEVNGEHKGNFIVDTGAVTTVLSHSFAAKLGVNENTPDAKVDLGIAGVGGMQGLVLRVPDVRFRVGEISESYEQVVSIDLKELSRMIGTEISGVMGADFFDTYKLALDYYGTEVRLSR